MKKFRDRFKPALDKTSVLAPAAIAPLDWSMPRSSFCTCICAQIVADLAAGRIIVVFLFGSGASSQDSGSIAGCWLCCACVDFFRATLVFLFSPGTWPEASSKYPGTHLKYRPTPRSERTPRFSCDDNRRPHVSQHPSTTQRTDIRYPYPSLSKIRMLLSSSLNLVTLSQHALR